MAIADVISCTDLRLPISVDVSVLVTRGQVEPDIDLTTLVFVQSSGGLPPGAGRVRVYLTEQSLTEDSDLNAEAKKAGTTFFAQSPRPRQMAVGQAFDVAVAGSLTTGGVTPNLAAILAVSDGSFTVSIDAAAEDITALDFTLDSTLADIAARIQTALQAVATGGFTASTCVVDGTQLIITSGTTGNLSSVSFLTEVSPASGTDVSGLGFLQGQSGEAITSAGYTPTGLAEEMGLINEAARCAGINLYAWALDKVYRTNIAELTDASNFAQASTRTLRLVTNDILAKDAGFSADIGSVISALGNSNTAIDYHDNVEVYPEVAVVAGQLAVDYSGIDTTITAQFKQLVDIPTVGITVTELEILESKRYNIYTATGQVSDVYRPGVTSSSEWFQEEKVNIDNLALQTQVNVFNLLLKTPKVPQNIDGQTLIFNSIAQIGEKFITNGTLADTLIPDASTSSGSTHRAAYTITSESFADQTPAQREAGDAPQVLFTVFLSKGVRGVPILLNIK